MPLDQRRDSGCGLPILGCVKKLLLALSCVSACIQFDDGSGSDSNPTATPIPMPGSQVVFFDTFETTGDDWSMVNASTTSGGLAGTASGTIGGGSLVQSATGAIGWPSGSGPVGVFETTLLSDVSLAPGDYSIQLTHQATPLGSAMSVNWLFVNGHSYSLVAPVLEHRTIAFTMTSSANLDLVFLTASGDDSGMVLTADLEVTEITVSRDP